MASFSRKNLQKSTSRKSHVLIESPVVKRIQSQPVTLQSWLLKRGSEGLMLWKKRWCVLSDYCLFYYKDQSEEKLLGSLILASYEISACNTEEKSYKKFSFKAEHTNMKTFYFAAENQSQMEEWMKAMKCASILEGNYSDDRRKSNDTRVIFQSSRFLEEVQPVMPNSDLLMANQKSPEEQPVYANAPPKPKRLNDSSSPECSIEIQFRDDNCHTYQSQPYQIPHIMSGQSQNFGIIQPQHANYERRTPDIYGRASFVQPITKPVNHNNLYIQDEQNALANLIKEQIISYAPKNPSTSSHSRPHSVDFLEYASKTEPCNVGSNMADKTAIPYRPKSSLSVFITNEEEGTHWSAEEYARKMRQSSMYVKPLMKSSLPMKTNSHLGNKDFSSQNSAYSSESLGVKQDPVMNYERSPNSLYRSQYSFESNEKTFFRSSSARLFRPMSPIVSNNELTQQTSDHTIHGSSAACRNPENTLSNTSPVNTHQQRDKPLERLLLWKERMSQSPLQRKNAEKITTDQSSSYTTQKRKNISILPNNEKRNETSKLHATIINDLLPYCEGGTNAPLKDISLQIEETCVELTSPMSLSNYSPNHHGFEESESNQENVMNSQTEKRKTNFEINDCLFNDTKRSSHHINDSDSFPNNNIGKNYEYSEDKSLLSLKTKYSVYDEKDNSIRTINSNNCDIETHKNKIINNSLTYEEFSTNSDRIQMQTKQKQVETEKDEEWGMKLDESRVIKEFSYHYITADKHEECSPIQNNTTENSLKVKYNKSSTPQDTYVIQDSKQSSQNVPLLPSQNIRNKDLSRKIDNNIVQNKKENNCQKICSKSPRKVSKSGVINKDNSLRGFRKEISKSFSKETVTKSMNCLENFEKRQVQSDSEALLYDTSSDVEEKPIFNREQLEKSITSSDDERDEEVAAVLANEKNFISPNFESVSSQQIDSPCLECEEKSIYCSKHIAAAELGITSKALESNTSYQICHEKNLSTSTDVNSDMQEENYMPMTPRKKSSKNEIIHSRSNSASHSLIMENLLGAAEESPYVEMTQNGPSNSCLMSDSFHETCPDMDNHSYVTTSENPRYCEIGKHKDTQYEFIYHNCISQEPVYMEVSTLKEKRDLKTSFSLINEKNSGTHDFNQDSSKEKISKKGIASRPSLPDILNTTTPSINQGSGGSDSSDADDEASKDLDSLDAPRHPRFSLSDTFRPASYYLGGGLGDRAIITINSEHQDSSDSDLVSPPPIPTSSPPLDDLDVSMDSTIGNKDNLNPIQIKNENPNNCVNEIFNESTVRELRSSYKLKQILRNASTNLYEASSEESVDYEKKEQRLKRRPLSADILNSLQDFNFIMSSPVVDVDDSDNIKLKDIYIEENESVESNNYFTEKLYKHKDRKYNNFFSVNSDDINIDVFDCDSVNEFRYKNNRINQSEYIYGSNFSESLLKNNQSKISSMNQYENLRDPVCEVNEGKIHFEKDQIENAVLNSDKSTNFNTVNAFTNNTGEQQNNAPYYYSDLLKIDTKNIQEYEKSKWEETTMSDMNENISSSFSNEKNVCYHSYNDFGSLNNKASTNEIYTEDYCSPDISNTENSDKQDTKKFCSQTPEYFESNYTANHNLKNCSQVESRELSELPAPHRSRSLEGLIDDHTSISEKSETNIFQKNSIVRLLKTQSQKTFFRNKLHSENCSKLRCQSSANPDIWEEDSLWRESLRKVSIRHTRSLEDLDRKDVPQSAELSSHINSEETYENVGSGILENNRYTCAKENSITNIDLLQNNSKSKNDLFHSNSKNNIIKKKNASGSILVNNCSESIKAREGTDGTNSSFEIDREKLRQWDLMSSAPAMLSTNRAMIKPITERNTNFTSSSLSGIENRTADNVEPLKENNKTDNILVKPEISVMQQEQEQGHGWNLKVSAGELLGRTHEELVLLLIQLRRQRATVCQSMEKCHREIEAQACLTDLDKNNRVEHLKKLDELKACLADLEKQYEKGKPLVNLVDNMVKLGSLYQAGSPEKLEFIQKIQEQRLLAEEKRDWERIRPDHHELKAKVERLYRLDKLLQEESGTLHSLQQDKGVLERALGGLRTKLQGIHGNSPETEWYKRQQRLLEKELSRVRSILALNSKKLEETVAENARLEQELVVLRQKLQLSRRTSEPGGTNTAALEAELCQVQLLVGNLLCQRQDLSLQVRQLTEKSNSLSRQIWPNSTHNIVENYNSGKKNTSSGGWVETDLDAEVTNDLSSPILYTNRNVRHHPLYISPLYVNTASERDIQSVCNSPYQDELFDVAAFSLRNLDFNRSSEMNDEEIIKQSYGLQFKEKPQEIKTVRIVKRESERRQRDRDRSGNIGIPITYPSSKRLPVTEERCSDKENSEKEIEEVELYPKSSDAPPTPGPRTDSMSAVWNLVRKGRVKGKLTTNKNDKNGSSIINNESPQLSPVYLSETARKIVEEVAWQGMGEKRLVPKEKRRHHTVSGPSISTPQNLYSQTGSRDDLDIERVLRPRLTTPDVVRSTLIRVDPHYTKETIDNLLGAPGKILIPERYIPETQPQLSREEQNKRSKKADAIRKMLCETTAVSPKDNDLERNENTSSLKRKVAEEKKNREHLLQLSHILAQQVMEKSKIVAGGNSTSLD